MSPLAQTSTRYSGRVGGTLSWRATVVWMSATAAYLLFLDAVREQHLVNAVGQLAPARRVGPVAVGTGELAPDLRRTRRKQQDAVADQHGLRNGMRHEQHREACIGPQLQ